MTGNFNEFGYSSNILLINSGPNLTILAGLIFMYPLVLALSDVPIKKLNLVVMKTKKKFEFNIFLRFWIQSYLELFLKSFFSLFSLLIIYMNQMRRERKEKKKKI